MKKIYICIGVNGSGKSTYVQKQLNEETLVINELDIQEVKKFLEDDTKSTLYVDSQNLKRRTRRGIYTCVQGKAEVIALCFLQPLSILVHNFNENKGQTISDVIEAYKTLQVPRIGVDCDKIEKVYGNNFNEFRHEFMGNLPHDNPNHKESINEHILMCIQNSKTKQLKEISKYHDLGKFICKEFISEHHAVYRNHDSVSAMYYLAKIDVTNQEKLDNMEVIYQHISVINDLTEKQIKRNKLEKIVPLMLEFREIDKKSRIV